MILIGQYDSPFVRRVAIALRLYGLAFEHRPWSTFGDAEKIAPYNPLRRVPTLIIDDGEVLIESMAILDHLDERVGPRHALIAGSGPARRQALKVCALATGLADKAVGLVYERILHDETSATWIARCEAQIAGVLDALEAECTGRPGPFWFGEAIGHADIAVACAIRFAREAHPGLIEEGQWTALAAHSARCERLEAFQEIAQPFLPPGSPDRSHAAEAGSDLRSDPLPSEPISREVRVDGSREIYSSSNGDSWHLVQAHGQVLVRHVPNLSSGGRADDIDVATFLARGRGPEQQELLRLIGTLIDRRDPG